MSFDWAITWMKMTVVKEVTGKKTETCISGLTYLIGNVTN